MTGDLPTPMSARSMQFGMPPPPPPRTPTTPAAASKPKSPRDEPHPFGRHELTHVRTFRVFGAIKGGVVHGPPPNLAGLPL
jgi:hypothetical protein